ncbi:unnamed protein product, partial [Heterosigma akashiwo]
PRRTRNNPAGRPGGQGGLEPCGWCGRTLLPVCPSGGNILRPQRRRLWQPQARRGAGRQCSGGTLCGAVLQAAVHGADERGGADGGKAVCAAFPGLAGDQGGAWPSAAACVSGFAGGHGCLLAGWHVLCPLGRGPQQQRGGPKAGAGCAGRAGAGSCDDGGRICG